MTEMVDRKFCSSAEILVDRTEVHESAKAMMANKLEQLTAEFEPKGEADIWIDRDVLTNRVFVRGSQRVLMTPEQAEQHPVEKYEREE